MKNKIIAAITLTLFMTSIFIALVLPMVSAQENIVGAWLDRLYYYDAGVFDDSVSHSDVLDGQRLRSFYIRPEGFDVDGARIEMNTIYPNTPEHFRGINWFPRSDDPLYPDVTLPEDPPLHLCVGLGWLFLF